MKVVVLDLAEHCLRLLVSNDAKAACEVHDTLLEIETTPQGHQMVQRFSMDQYFSLIINYHRWCRHGFLKISRLTVIMRLTKAEEDLRARVVKFAVQTAENPGISVVNALLIFHGFLMLQL